MLVIRQDAQERGAIVPKFGYRSNGKSGSLAGRWHFHCQIIIDKTLRIQVFVKEPLLISSWMVTGDGGGAFGVLRSIVHVLDHRLAKPCVSSASRSRVYGYCMLVSKVQKAPRLVDARTTFMHLFYGLPCLCRSAVVVGSTVILLPAIWIRTFSRLTSISISGIMSSLLLTTGLLLFLVVGLL